MNTLSRLDYYVSSLIIPQSDASSSLSTTPIPDSATADVPVPPRLTRLPPTPRKARKGRRPKPTIASIKLPPPSTPFLLRILLGLWSILLSFWRSLVGETRAERVKRRKRTPALLSALHGDLGTGSEVEGEGSASEIEGVGSDDDGWVDPVTRAVNEKVDQPADDEFASGPPKPSETIFTFRLRSAEKKETTAIHSVDASPPNPPVYTRQPTPPSILSNPISPKAKTRQPRLLPNPMATSLLDPSVPAIPASQTMSTTSLSPLIPAPRSHQTPFHLQKTLILDLDETLIHSTSRPISYAASAGGGLLGLSFGGLLGGRGKRREGHTVEVVHSGRSTTYHVYKRPCVDHFLKKVASWYTLVIFTASIPEYADPVIDWLDGGRGLFAKKFYRESCHLQPNGSYIKDLALVEADLTRVCFMDNSPISYAWNKANALPIEGWTSDPNDEALLHSIPVLDSLRFVNDVRRILGIRGFS